MRLAQLLVNREFMEVKQVPPFKGRLVATTNKRHGACIRLEAYVCVVNGAIVITTARGVVTSGKLLRLYTSGDYIKVTTKGNSVYLFLKEEGL